nr:sugar transferase [Celeribacter neptunius]
MHPTSKAKFSLYKSVGKRLFDLLFFFMVSPIVVPVILILALLVKLDGGPAFYAQRRVGRNGKTFQFYKLRSMHVDADAILLKLCQENPEIAKEWQTYQKLRHDPRITKIGNFIRKTSLDELPQVLNVLKGDMSFVGPRPFMPSQQMMYEAAKGEAYFKMRPGITGLWQVSGRGETSFVARIKFDNLYYRKLSLMTDIALILRTVTVVLKPTGH